MTVHPSCYRSQAKRERKITREWFERCLVKAFTQDDIVEKIRSLDNEKLVRLYYDFTPKPIQNEIAGLQVNLILNGIEPKQIPGQIVQHELPESTES